MKNRLSLLLVTLMFTVLPMTGQKTPVGEYSLKYGASCSEPRQDTDMQRFRHHRLGAFVHWGLYAIPGGTWEGKTYRGAAEGFQ